MNKLEEYVNVAKLNELVNRGEAKKEKSFVTILAVIGTITAIVAIGYAVYKYLVPDYFEDYEDFDDEFDEFDEFENDLDVEKPSEKVVNTEEIISQI